MPTNNNSQLELHSYNFEYSTLENEESRADFVPTECKFPEYPKRTIKKRHRNIVTGIIWSGLLLWGFLLGAGIVIAVLFLVKTDNNGLDSNSPEYSLYKNTMFEDCYNMSVSATTVDCSSIKAILQEIDSPGAVAALGNSYLSQSRDSKNSSTAYGWCEIMSCYNGFKIVPSTPRPSAFWVTALEAWDLTAITFFMSFWQLNKLHKALYNEETSPCKRIEWDTWIILAWDLTSFIWWCIGFGRFAMTPNKYTVPSMLGWIALWKYSCMLRYHPYGCVLRRIPRTAQIAQWTLNTLATLVWIASAYICIYSYQSAVRHISPYSAYDCLASRIMDAPGASTCSAEQICSHVSLFSSYTFRFPGQYMQGYMNLTLTFYVLSVIALYMICIIGIFPLIGYMIKGGSVQKWRKRLATRWDFGFAGGIGMASVAYTAYGALTLIDAMRAFSYDREGPVAFYWDCNALHVNVSPWRYYLDVSHDRVARLAKMWFNA